MTNAEIIAVCAILVSVGTFTVSVLALRTTLRLWRFTNRPLVSVTVETVKSGNMGTALSLVVSNAGNRSAKDVRLSTDEALLGRLLALGADDATTVAVRKCFALESTIPMLIPGRSYEGSFGLLAVGLPQSTWREQTTLPVEVSYTDLEMGTPFRYVVNVRIADNATFTGSGWNRKPAQEDRR